MRAHGEAGTPIAVRLTAAERELYCRAADAEDISHAEWIRAAYADRPARKRR